MMRRVKHAPAPSRLNAKLCSAMSRGGDGDAGADQRRYRGQAAPEDFGHAAEKQVAHHPAADSADGA